MNYYFEELSAKGIFVLIIGKSLTLSQQKGFRAAK
jgi:hypothetical protein